MQTLLVDKGGAVYAATAPDGKVYRIAAKGTPAKPAKADSKPADSWSVVSAFQSAFPRHVLLANRSVSSPLDSAAAYQPVIPRQADAVPLLLSSKFGAGDDSSSIFTALISHTLGFLGASVSSVVYPSRSSTIGTHILSHPVQTFPHSQYSIAHPFEPLRVKPHS